jgi:hypothetical protein
MAFDLKQQTNLAIEQTAEMVLVNPVTGVDLFDPDKGEEDGVVKFTLVSKSNPKHLKAVEVLNKAQAKRGNRKPTMAEAREESVNFLVALSISVDNLEYDGQPINTPAAFKALYEDEEYSWVRDQVSDFLSKETNFIHA